MVDLNAGDIDPEFGDGNWIPISYGTQTQLMGATWDTDIATPRIYLVGGVEGGKQFFVAACAGDGTPDDTFGVYLGTFLAQEQELKGGQAYALKAYVQRDKLMVFGAVKQDVSAEFLPAFARFHLDGQLDTTFGEADNPGHVIVKPDLPDGVTLGLHVLSRAETSDKDGVSSASDLTIRVTARHLYVLLCGPYGSSANVVMRLDHMGRPDITFNQTGTLMIRLPFPNLSLRSMEVNDRDHLVLTGSADPDGDERLKAVFVGVTAAGELDDQFGDHGFVLVDVPNTSVSVVGSFAKQQVTEAVVGIGGTSAGKLVLAMVSVNQNGTPDIDFNGGEPLFLSQDLGKERWTHGLQGPTNLLLGGHFWNEQSTSQTALIGRVLLTGGWDTSFGAQNRGWVRLTPSFGVVVDLAVQFDNRLLVAGEMVVSGIILGFLVRYIL